MKKHIITYFLFTIIVIGGCKKNDGAIPENVKIQRVPEPLVVKNGGSQAIDLTNLSSFLGKFDVGLYFGFDTPPTKFDVVIRKNSNNGNIKVFKPDVTSFPSTFTITAVQIATLFGTPIALGDNFDISVDIYAPTGIKYEAFPSVGAGYGSNVDAQPGASTSIRYSAICAYNPSVYQGNFRIVTDEWADYNTGDIVSVTSIDATHFSFFYGAAGPLPIIVTVNPLNNVTSVAKQVYGTLGYPPGWPYGPISCESVASPLNVVAPCDQSFGVNLSHSVTAGVFGSFFIKMKKI